MKIERCWLDRAESVPLPKGYGLAYTEYVKATEIYYPIPINYIVRYWLKYYWGFLRAMYWVGLIDTKEAECFRWGDFFRMRH